MASSGLAAGSRPVGGTFMNVLSSTPPSQADARSLKGEKKSLKLYRTRSNTDSDLAPPSSFGSGMVSWQFSNFDGASENTVPLPPHVRDRLYDLFGLIEKEFESLYTENVTLRAKLAALAERLPEGEVARLGVEFATPEITLSAGETSGNPTKPFKKASQQMGQRIRTAFRGPSGRFVSSFKANVTGVGSSDALRVRLVGSFEGHRDGIWDLDVSHGPKPVLGSGSADQTARIWHIDSGTCLVSYAGHTGSVNSIRFSPTSTNPNELWAVTASGDQSAHVWRASNLASTVLPSAAARKSSEDEAETPSHLGFDNIDPESMPASGSAGPDGQGTGTIIRQPKVQLTGHTSVVSAADWLCNGRQVVTGSWDHTANIYDVEKGEILNMLTGHDQEVTHVSAHLSQKLVLTSSKDFTFRLWDFREQINSVAVFQGHAEAVTSAVFSSTDRVVSGSDDRTVKIWDLKNMRTALATIRLDSPVNRLSVSSKFNVIAIPHDNRNVRIYDLNGVRIARLQRSSRRGHRRLVCATTWADDHPKMNLFTCGFDRMILGWKYLPQAVKE